jgi:hypothetical protein
MKHRKPIYFATAVLMLIGVSACQNDGDSAATGQPAADSAKPAPAVADVSIASPGKPTAPISISYEVIGNAFVGSPVSINIVVTSDRGPVNVRYSIIDSSAMMFQTGQVERLEIADPSAGSLQQLAVIPQREGRLYVNVSAEIETADGLNIRSMAIPIKVGRAPEKATINGELVEGPDGETVISMPAQESN